MMKIMENKNLCLKWMIWGEGTPLFLVQHPNGGRSEKHHGGAYFWENLGGKHPYFWFNTPIFVPTFPSHIMGSTWTSGASVSRRFRGMAAPTGVSRRFPVPQPKQLSDGGGAKVQKGKNQRNEEHRGNYMICLIVLFWGGRGFDDCFFLCVIFWDYDVFCYFSDSVFGYQGGVGVTHVSNLSTGSVYKVWTSWILRMLGRFGGVPSLFEDTQIFRWWGLLDFWRFWRNWKIMIFHIVPVMKFNHKIFTVYSAEVDKLCRLW